MKFPQKYKRTCLANRETVSLLRDLFSRLRDAIEKMTRSSSRMRGPFKGVHVNELSSRMKFSLLWLSVYSNPTLDTSVRAYSPRRLLYKSKTGEKSTRSERAQESGVERVGWRSLSGWVADTGRDACCREVGGGRVGVHWKKQ